MSGIESLFSGMRTSASGLAAERVRIDVIAENIANAQVTRTPEGGAYRRRIVHFEPLVQSSEQGRLSGGGVRVSGIAEDWDSPMEYVDEPGHPDADENGLLELPNVNTVAEMADLITAMRAYEANLTAQQSFVRMAERALELAR